MGHRGHLGRARARQPAHERAVDAALRRAELAGRAHGPEHHRGRAELRARGRLRSRAGSLPSGRSPRRDAAHGHRLLRQAVGTGAPDRDQSAPGRRCTRSGGDDRRWRLARQRGRRLGRVRTRAARVLRPAAGTSDGRLVHGGATDRGRDRRAAPCGAAIDRQEPRRRVLVDEGRAAPLRSGARRSCAQDRAGGSARRRPRRRDESDVARGDGQRSVDGWHGIVGRHPGGDGRAPAADGLPGGRRRRRRVRSARRRGRRSAGCLHAVRTTARGPALRAREHARHRRCATARLDARRDHERMQPHRAGGWFQRRGRYGSRRRRSGVAVAVARGVRRRRHAEGRGADRRRASTRRSAPTR